MASQIVRYSVPVGATFFFHGTVLAESRPNPAAVYAEPSPVDCPGKKTCTRIPNREADDTALERLVMKSRQSFGPYYDKVLQYADEGVEEGKKFCEKVKDNLCYLRTRAPQEMRIGTVVAGGLTGLLLGVKSSKFKQLLLTAVGTGGGAYIAYPHETEKYTKKYASIAYNFVAGNRK